MNDWDFKFLEKYDDQICEIAEGYGLDWFPINYEVCDYYEMIGHMSYHGMPSHYPHWSYGKSFERTHQMYSIGAEGLPYELIINSNPSIAYLMRQNPAYLQVLIMAHCVGHSDFFKNNREFKSTHPEIITSKFRNARKRIQGYCENTNIGLEKVEFLLDVLHTIRFQTERNGRERVSREKIKERYIKKINSDKSGKMKDFDVNKNILEPDYDILGFLLEYGSHFESWEQDIINIVRDESHYFIPQIKTKIMNEGWASFWHYKIMNDLNLSQDLHIPFLKTHNQVIRPHIGGINPYHVGFYIFQKLEREGGLDECFFARDICNDVSGIMCHLDFEDMRELNLFSYSDKKKGVIIDDISDEPGWKEVKKDLIKSTGMNSMPLVFISDISDDGCLILQHEHDGRDLELEYAERVVEKIGSIWPNDVKFFTIIEDEAWEI
jgi:stage V sporulation protein R